jgi:hypothetical protein
MVPVPDMSWALLGVLILLGALGALGAVYAWRMAVREPEREPRIEVLAGIGGGLITGIAVGLSALFLEQSLGETQKYASWRANVEIASSIPGFMPGDRNIEGINFSGKELRNADFTGIAVRDVQFRDADLTGAVFDRADLRGANLIGANFYEASLKDAKLDRALLQGANLTGAIIATDDISFRGAQVNAETCWPEGVPQRILDMVTDLANPADRSPGQIAPNCTLWDGKERTR